MFDSEMKESASNEVEVPDVAADVFKAMLQYIYGGLSPKSMVDVSHGLLAAADKYGLDELKMACESFICGRLQTTNVIEALLLAEKYDCQRLMNRGIPLFRANSATLKKSKDWAKLRSSPDLVLKLLEHCCE